MAFGVAMSELLSIFLDEMQGVWPCLARLRGWTAQGGLQFEVTQDLRCYSLQLIFGCLDPEQRLMQETDEHDLGLSAWWVRRAAAGRPPAGCLCSGGPETYAKGRWLRFSDPTMQRWYAQQMQLLADMLFTASA